MANSRKIHLRVAAAASAVLALALLAFVCHAVFDFGGYGADVFFNSWIYNGLLLCAAAACLGRSILIRRERLAWGLIGAGLLAWTAGEIFYSLVYGAAPVVPIPSPADAGYLLLYPLTYAGMAILFRGRVGSVSLAQWLDGLICGSAVAAIALAIALEPILAVSTTGSTAAVATNLAYPIGDLTLLTLVVTASALTGWRPGRSWLALGGGLAVLAISDGLYLLQSAQGTYVGGGLLDVAWPVGALLLAAGAWLGSSQKQAETAAGLRMAVVPVLAAVVALLVLFGDRFTHVPLLASVLALFTLLCVVVRMALSFRENRLSLRSSVHDSLTDALTGLANRRRLMADLDLATSLDSRPGRLHLLVLFDLDGFKAYNDTFGHPAGDALLARLGTRFAAFAANRGTAYRLGGDEFCLLAVCTAAEVDGFVAGAVASLSDRGEGFVITSSHGSVLLPSEASSTEAAIQLADSRMYANKSRDRASAGAQSRNVLMSALREMQPCLHTHLLDVADLAGEVARAFEMTNEQRDEVVRAAELHDTGKMAIPEAILRKPGPLDGEEWGFMHRHTLIGERIIGAAPALKPVARLVRSSHERWDGTGYPDHLAAHEIPLGSRIVAVCDAFEAMTAERPYGRQMTRAEALEELDRCGGSQFDPAVVTAFAAAVRTKSRGGLDRQPSSVAAPK